MRTIPRALALGALLAGAALAVVAQERDEAPQGPTGEAAAVDSGDPAAVDSAAAAAVASGDPAAVASAQALAAQRLQRLLQLDYDRRPSAVLAALAGPEEAAPAQGVGRPAAPSGNAAGPPLPEDLLAQLKARLGAAPGPAPIKVKVQPAEAEAASAATASDAPAAATTEADPLAEELKGLQRAVTLGEWEAVGEYLAGLPEDHAPQAYRRLLQVLGVRPGTPFRPGPDGTPQPVEQPVRPHEVLAEDHAIAPEDVLGLADAAPALDAAALPLLGKLLAKAVSQGHVLDGLLAAWREGARHLGGEEPARRRAAATVLLEAGLAREAGDFLPTLEAAREAGALEDLALLVRRFVGLYESDAKGEDLEAAWEVNQELLAAEELPGDQRRAALERAVELAPRVRDELGEAWLAGSFARDAERARRVLTTIGARAAGTRQGLSGDPSARLAVLRLQHTAVEALLAHAPQRAAELAAAADLLARNWLFEAEYSLTNGGATGGAPQFRRDRYGNIYYAEESKQGNRPQPVGAHDLLEVAPGAAWRALAGESLGPRLLEVTTRLHLGAGDEEAAFPLIEALAAGGQGERAHAAAEELLRVWTKNHDLNSGRSRTNRYMFMWGFERRADAIPLTRSKQERNLAELAELIARLRALPIEPLDEALLADAFIRSHSAAEVYRLEAIEQVFGAPGELEPATLARLIQTMRANLAGAWRDPKLQEAQQTQRTDEELRAEVLRGYAVAGRLARDGLQAHAESWQLQLARASVALDQNDYANRQLGRSADYTPRRREALAGFATAAQAYARGVAGLGEDEETTEPFDRWFYASLGAADLERVSHEHQPDASQWPAIRAALEALPGEAAARHLERFANALFTRMSAVNPAVKVDYLEGGFAIVGDDHEAAREARKVLDYYQDLVHEIQLRTRLDGSSRVGHERPFGLFVELRHTEAIERESGGFGKYLQNQNSVRFAWNYGRPLEDYRDKFETAAREALAEHFDVLSVTFHDPKVTSRGDPEHGWRVTPYAYLLLQARGPQVDTLPSLSMDLDFLDTSGYMVLPVTSTPIPLDARPGEGDARPLDDLKVVQTLDERRAGEGLLVLEVEAEAHGLVPPLADLIDLSPGALDPFEVVEVEDQGLSATRLDPTTEELAVVSERHWLVSLRGREGLARLPETFRFPDVRLETAELTHQRYEDADLAEVSAEVPLEATYGEEAAPLWPWLAGGCVLCVGLLLFLATRPTPDAVAGPTRYALPQRVTPFTVLTLLQRIRAEADLDPPTRAQLDQAIASLERRYFANGETEVDQEALAQVAREWAGRAR